MDFNQLQNESDLFLFYDEKGNLVFNENIKKRLSFPFRTGLGFGYKRSFIFVFTLMLLSPFILFVLSNRFDYIFSFEFFNYILLIIVIMLIIKFIRGILDDINSIYGIKGARRGEARINLRAVFYDDNFFERYVKDKIGKLYLSNNIDRFAFIVSFTSYTYFYFTDAMIRYKISNGDLYYTIFGMWTNPVSPPFFLAFLPIFIHYTYGLTLFVGLLYVTKISLVLIDLGRLYKLSDNFGLTKLVNSLLLRWAGDRNKELSVTHSNFKRIYYAYTSVWRLGNSIASIALKISLFFIVVSSYLYLIVIIPLYFPPPGKVPNLTAIGVFSIYYYFAIAIAIVLFFAPFFGFYRLNKFYKSVLIGYTEDLYQRKIFRYLSIPRSQRIKSPITREISVLQDSLIYIQELNVWPFSVPQIVRLSIFTIASAILPQFIQFLHAGV